MSTAINNLDIHNAVNKFDHLAPIPTACIATEQDTTANVNATTSNFSTTFSHILANGQQTQKVTVLMEKLQEAYLVIKQERQDKQHILLLLKEKLAEIKTTQFKMSKIQENIKCCQEHIHIERENHQTTRNKLTYLAEKLQAAEQAIQQQNQTINTLKAEHEESMRKTKLLIEEFYHYKFLEEITYADLDKIQLQEMELHPPMSPEQTLQ